MTIEQVLLVITSKVRLYPLSVGDFSEIVGVSALEYLPRA